MPYTRDEQISIANTIISQLGGSKFRVMTGARNIFANDSGVSFSLPGSGGFCKNGINHVKIDLTSLDLYDMKFSRIRGNRCTVISTREGVYDDMLQDIFKTETGLNTSL